MTVDLVSSVAEQAIIGSLMLDNRGWSLIGSRLTPEHFGYPEHRRIMEAIRATADAGMPFDMVTIAQVLGGKDDLTYLGELIRNSFVAANLEQYADIVLDRYARRQCATAGSAAVGIARSAETAADAVAQVRAMLDAIDNNAAQGVKSVQDAMNDWTAMMYERKARGGCLQGITTGFDCLDSRWFGLCAPDLIIVAGRPSMGKTTFGMNLAESAAKTGSSVLVFSLEMSTRQLYDRRVSAVSGVPLESIRACDMDPDEWGRVADAGAQLKARKLFIDDRSGQSIDAVRLSAAAHKSKHGLDLVVVDYLGLLQKPGSESRLQEVRAISAGLKQMAKELNIPVVALAQLNRKSEERGDKRPIMSDLRESGDLEQDADIIAFVHRQSKYEPENPEWAGVAEIITDKNRNGECGTDFVASQLEFARFRPLSYEFKRPTKTNNRKERP